MRNYLKTLRRALAAMLAGVLLLAAAQARAAVAGSSLPGDTNYEAPLRPEGDLRLDIGEGNLKCVTVDEVHGYAYYGTNTSVGRIIKVRLSDFARVATLTLKPEENYLTCGVVDAAGIYAYFFAQGYNGQHAYPGGTVVKVRLSDFTRVGALAMNVSGYSPVGNAAIDSVQNLATFYFYTYNSGDSNNPSKALFITVRLSDLTIGNRKEMLFDTPFAKYATFDPAGGFAYVCSSGSMGSVLYKVRLSDFAQVGRLYLSAYEEYINSTSYDFKGGYGYFGGHGFANGGTAMQVRLSDLKVTAKYTLSSEEYLANLAVDHDRGYLYILSFYGKLFQVCLADFRLRGSVKLTGGGSGYLPMLALDRVRNIALVSSNAIPGQVAGVRLSEFRQTGLIQCNVTIEDNPRCAVIDPIRGYAYFGTGTTTGTVARVRLADTMHEEGLKLNAGEGPLGSAVIDPLGGYAYFGTDTAPGKVIKVRLSDFTRVGSVTLNPGENNLTSAVIDPVQGFAYFGTNSSPGRVVQVRLADLKRRGAVTLNAGENALTSAVIDPAKRLAYFGTNTSPGIVVKLRLATFARVGALKLAQGNWSMAAGGIYGDNGLLSAAIDPAAGYAYFGTTGFDELNEPTGSVVKVRLTDFTRVGAVKLPGSHQVRAAAIDPAHGNAYFVYDAQHFHDYERSGLVCRVRLADFRVSDVHDFYKLYSYQNAESSQLACAVVDPAGGYAYLGANGDTGVVYRMGLTTKDSLQANRITLPQRAAIKDVRFYSHAAKGNVRLAIYSDETTRTLLWQSGSLKNTAADGWITVPVAAGSPSQLTLNAGKYWLGWQCDAGENIAGASDTASDSDGLWLDWTYGPFPATISPLGPYKSGIQWSEYLTY